MATPRYAIPRRTFYHAFPLLYLFIPMFAVIRHAGYRLTDGSLTSDGIQVAQVLAKKLQRCGTMWKSVQTSPSQRTQETASIIAGELHVPVSPDPRISTKGNCVDFFPPMEPKDTILVSHLPVVTKLMRFWSKALGKEEPPLTEMGRGYLIDPDQRVILPLDTNRSTSEEESTSSSVLQS